MTIHSNDRDPQRNDRDPQRPDILRRSEPGMTTGTMAAVAVAAILGLGTVWYMMSDDRANTASTTPPATTGQSVPAPTPAPAPQNNPAPAQ